MRHAPILQLGNAAASPPSIAQVDKQALASVRQVTSVSSGVPNLGRAHQFVTQALEMIPFLDRHRHGELEGSIGASVHGIRDATN